MRVNWLLAGLLAALTGTGCGNARADKAASLTGGDPERGAAAIHRYGCGSCHTIKGIASARGLAGPPLSGVANRLYIAGMLPNTPDNLESWIRHPRQVNQNTAMPDTGVTARDATDIAAYLYTIE